MSNILTTLFSPPEEVMDENEHPITEHQIKQCEIQEEKFEYSIKSTSKKRFTHPEQYAAQLNWEPPGLKRNFPAYYNYGPNFSPDSYRGPRLTLHKHARKIVRVQKKIGPH